MSSSMTSPSQSRRKPPPTRVPSPEPPPLPDLPQEDNEGEDLLAGFNNDDNDDNNNEEANTTSIIDPSTVPPSRSSLFPSLLGPTAFNADVTPRASRSCRPDWDTSDSYIPHQNPLRTEQAQEPRAPTPTINIDLNDPPESQDTELPQEELEVLKIFLSKPSRSNDPIYQYVRKESKKLLTKNKISTSGLNSPIKSQEPEVPLWMSAVFGNTIKKLKPFIPIPEEAMKAIIPGLPEISISEFTKQSLEEAN